MAPRGRLGAPWVQVEVYSDVADRFVVRFQDSGTEVGGAAAVDDRPPDHVRSLL